MRCVCSVKLIKEQNHLLIDRVRQKELCDRLSKNLNYNAFVFNTQSGLYCFLDREDFNQERINSLERFLKSHAKFPFRLNVTVNDPHYFAKEIAEVLSSRYSSAIAWKRFISSFLAQLDPFVGETKSIHALFKNFIHVLKTVGDDKQMKYLKRKMNNLRARVELPKDF